MEHKIILGGAQYLPFARSRIKALRATLQRYATQRFVFPDATVTVQIEPEQDYIYITGSGCVLEMDSGMMNLSSIAPLEPARYLPGVLFEVGSAIAYNAAFLAVEGKNFRSHSGDSGQIAGAITSAKTITGKIFDTPKSFKPRTIDANPPTVPQTRVPDPADDNLYAKKRAAVLCPPSIFTGKCRLYVQAMYGTPLDNNNPPLEVVSETTAAPALRLPAYTRSDDEQEYQPILLDTSCGVYLDPANGNHWLFNPTGNELRIYPLVSTRCAEALRPLLKADSSLNQTDRDHLEAYILSGCRPDVRRAHAASSDLAGAGTYSMGYGWHWNWDGTTADIVENEMWDQGDAYNFAMRSTHFRMAMSKAPIAEPGSGADDPQVQWTNTVTVVEGPIDWMVARGVWCIAEPNYATMTLVKATPRNSIRFTCDAPFYVFYDRNDIKICRVNVSFHAGGNEYRIMSDNFAGSLVYDANDIFYATLGERDGFLEEGPDSGSSYKAVFTIGDEASGECYEGMTNSGIRHDLTDKVINGYAGATTDTFFIAQTFEYGYPDEFGVYAEETVVRNSVTTDTGIGWYDLTLGYYEDQTAGFATIVIPFYDSEAVYMQWSNTVTRTTYGDKRRYSFSLGGFEFVKRYRVSVHIPPLSSELRTYLRYDWENGGPSSPGVTLDSTTPVSATVPTTAEAEVLVCRAGVIEATFTNLSAFHDNAVDEVEANFSTLTATSKDAPVVVAPGYAGPVGLGSAEASTPVLLGWI